MALPTIIFNNSSGSDTAASGAGPATALFGTGCALVATTAVTLAVDSPDLSGVATDGSACMWVDTASGRQFSRITAVDNGTKVVTVATAYGVTASGLTWGIGGKRKTLDDADSRKLGVDIQAGWAVYLEDNQSLTSAFTWSAVVTTATPLIYGPSGRVSVTQTANAKVFDCTGNYYRFEHLEFYHSNATKTNAVAIGAIDASGIICVDCVFGDSTNKLAYVFHTTTRSPTCWTLIDCRICDLTGIAIYVGGGKVVLYGCQFLDNDDYCLINQGSGSIVIINCIFNANSKATNGIIYNDSTPLFVFVNNTVNGNTASGVMFTSGAGRGDLVINNNFTANGIYGFNGIADQDRFAYINYNNYGTGATANTSGARNTITAGANDLAVDPQYTNSGSQDFSVGTNVQAKGIPDATRKIGANPSSGSVSYVDIGAVQRQEAAGGTTIVEVSNNLLVAPMRVMAY